MNSIITGVIGGGLVLLAEQILDYIKNKKEETDKKSLFNPNSRRLLTNELVDTFSPERNYKKVKEILGEPDKTFRDYSIFDNNENSYETGKEYYSDLYRLENATLKITTSDNKSISSITVFSYDEKIEIPYYEFFCSEKNDDYEKSNISEEFVKDCTKSIEIRTIREMAFAVQGYTGAPLYKHLTLFTFPPKIETKVEDLIGNKIEGFCLSDNSQDAFYIYEYEYR